MKEKTIICSVVLLVLSMFIASTVIAGCPTGKTEVTIVSGKKIMEMCLPDQTVDKIGGPGHQVIPATCPCFSQEDVETAIANDPYAEGYMQIGTYEDGSTPYFHSVLIAGELMFNVQSPRQPEHYDITEKYVFNECDPDSGMCHTGPSCYPPDELSICQGEGIFDCSYTQTSDDEAKACLAILQTLDWVPDE